MIVFVDNEHAKGFQQPWGEKAMAARLRIKYRLEDMSGHQCLIVGYTHVTPDLLQTLNVQAVFVSGHHTLITEYIEEELSGLRAIFRQQNWPVFGFCGGFQLMADTYGVKVAPIGPLPPGQTDDPQAEYIFLPGMQQEFGYMPVRILEKHPLFESLGDEPTFRQAHYWEIKSVPADFNCYVATDVTPIQLIIHDNLPIVGCQFHPEYYTEEHPDGKQLLQNFLKLAKIIP